MKDEYFLPLICDVLIILILAAMIFAVNSDTDAKRECLHYGYLVLIA